MNLLAHQKAKLARDRAEEQARKAWAAEERKIAAQQAKQEAQRRREDRPGSLTCP